MEPRLSVIVPVLNEEARIQSQLAALRRVHGIDEVLVVDGGSTDRTREIVEREPWRQLIEAPRGRARQMNAGAAAATGSVLIFLHADTTLPLDAASVVRAALDDDRMVAGAFRTKTVAEGRKSWVTRWLRIADLRSRYSRLPYGDQALFVRREIFERIGGFPDQLLFEDLEMSRRLRRVGRILTVKADVKVSGRRFVARPFYHALIMTLLPVLYRLGVSPSTLARAYPDIR